VSDVAEALERVEALGGSVECSRRSRVALVGAGRAMPSCRLEDLGNILVLLTDKTGTLTEGAITFAASLDGAAGR
jgi:hypothetical protein